MPRVPIVIPSEIAIVLNSIGVPPAALMPSLTLAASARRWKLHGIVSIHVLATPMIGLRERLVVVADALQVRARGRAVAALGERAGAVLEVELARHAERTGVARPRRRAATGGAAGRPRRGGVEALALPAAEAPDVALDLRGSTWRPGRCMLALEIRRRSSPLSAIHLASTSSESGSRALP